MEGLSEELSLLDREIDALRARLEHEVARRRSAEAELQSAEQRSRDFAECAGDWFWDTDGNLKLRYVSERFEAATGIAAAHVVGKTLDEITTPEHRADEGAQWRTHFEALAHRRAFSGLEMPIARDDETPIYAVLAGKPVFDADDHFIGYRGAARDVTHYKDATRRLEQQSSHDALTGISNRRRLDEFLEHEWNSAERSGAQLAVILADVDAFKAFNDHYGHAAGDECLAAIAGAFEQALRRKVDLAARYGGEEFCCVLPGTDQIGAEAVAERLRRDVADLNIPHACSETADRVTISLGVAVDRPSAQHEPHSLLSRADANLYEAKRRGRNQVVGDPEIAQVVAMGQSANG